MLCLTNLLKTTIMFKLILRVISNVLLSVLIPIRANSKHKIKELGVVFTRDVVKEDKSFTLTISRTIYSIHYKCYLIPAIKESIYIAKITDETGKEHFTRHYPLLSFSGIIDSSYPLNCIAQIHLEDFFQQSQGE